MMAITTTRWKAFKTEREYKKALKRTIEIFHAKKDTPESDELDALLPLIIAYEDIHYPIPAPDAIDN
jgi:HTH-type transcriptional regulator / antitoxin HigA